MAKRKSKVPTKGAFSGEAEGGWVMGEQDQRSMPQYRGGQSADQAVVVDLEPMTPQAPHSGLDYTSVKPVLLLGGFYILRLPVPPLKAPLVEVIPDAD